MNSLPMLTVDGTEYESDKCSIKYTRRFIYVELFFENEFPGYAQLLDAGSISLLGWFFSNPLQKGFNEGRRYLKFETIDVVPGEYPGEEERKWISFIGLNDSEEI